jgi:hypothetical protein
MAVDAKHKLIAADDVTNEVTDYKQLANVALEAKANLELKQAEVVADAGYYNAAEVSRCAEQGLTAYVPKADTSANTARGLYGKSRFRYDEVKDVYVCPAGGELTHRFNTYELGRELRYYRASGCKGCALKKKCKRGKANRRITREENEGLMEAMAARMKAQPWKFKLRKELAEHPFGTIKRWFGYTHFLLKGLEKVRTEWRFTPKAFGADDAGLQPQTSAEPGELREIDASSGSKSSAKRLKRGGRPFFSFVGDVILPDCYPDEPNLWKTKTGDLNFRTAGQTFSPPTTRAALEFSHRLATC